MTVTAGVRYDRQRPYYTSSKRAPIFTYAFPTQTVPGKTLFVSNNFAPRIGVSYDPGGNGKTAIKAFYGRYYYNFADSFTAVDPGGTNTKTYKFNDLNGNGLYDGPQELGQLISSTGGTSTTLSSNLKTPHTDEFDLSYQRQFWGESSFRVAYVRKMQRDQFSTYNTAWAGQFTVPVTVPVTLQSYDGGVSGTQNYTVYDIPGSLAGQTPNAIAQIPGSGGNWNYDTIELAFNKRFQKGLFLDTSWDWTRSNDLESPANVTNSPLQQSDVISPPNYFENPYPTVSNRQTTTSWEFHLSSRYELPYQIGIGANFEVQSGWNYARIITVDLPNAGTQQFWMQNLNNNRSDTVSLLNLRFDRAISFAGHRLTGMIDIFNLLNANPVTNFNLLNGSRFNQINGLLDPRTLQLGLRFEF